MTNSRLKISVTTIDPRMKDWIASNNQGVKIALSPKQRHGILRYAQNDTARALSNPGRIETILLQTSNLEVVGEDTGQSHDRRVWDCRYIGLDHGVIGFQFELRPIGDRITADQGHFMEFAITTTQ